jgi:DNA-binding transcriptional regulator YdaS (Cro superfamily)
MELREYLSKAGAGAALAKKLDISPVLVSQWRTGKRRVPAHRCPEIELATDGSVRCEDLRPEIDWAVLRPAE